MIKKPKRAPKLGGLERRADAVYSHYIRFSSMNKHGMIRCYTCGRWKPWKEMELGHYVNRRCKTTRFEEMNTKPQCTWCNHYREGAKEHFIHKLKREYGDDVNDRLLMKKRNRIYNYRMYLNIIIDEYSKKVAKVIQKSSYTLPQWIVQKYKRWFDEP